MIRVAILEDNAADAAVLRDSLRRYEEKRRGKLSSEIEECGDCLEFLDNYQPNYDILFFDIEMPNLNGMIAAQKIYEKDKDVVMVFVTNLEKYAVQGYRVDAMGYFLNLLRTVVLPRSWTGPCGGWRDAAQRRSFCSTAERSCGFPFQIFSTSK